MARVLIERDSRRLCPVTEAVWAMSTLDYDSVEIWRWTVGWLVLITAT
jgi:hypothetical protein